VIALVGQPSIGKSALFNRLTDKIVRIGNFLGTTIEIEIGHFKGLKKSM